MTPLKPGRISIGVPTRNRSELLLRAVRSALAQTYPDIEVVVSDNASTDDSVSRIRALQDPRIVRLEQAADIGMTGNFNACLHNASGEFLIMLSDDDVLEPTAAEELSRPFRGAIDRLSGETVGISWSPAAIIGDTGEFLWTTRAGPEIEPSVSLVAGLFNGTRGPRFCSILLRTADALAVGGYDPNHGSMCDVGNWARVALKYESAYCLPHPVAKYTMHQTSVTSQSSTADWQRAGENVAADVVQMVQGDPGKERRLRAATRNGISSQILTVLLQTVGKPGWIPRTFREVLRAPQYLLTPFVFRRVIVDGWKLLRMR
jgi:hypothetical protein